jgi:hypothetical protein
MKTHLYDVLRKCDPFLFSTGLASITVFIAEWLRIGSIGDAYVSFIAAFGMSGMISIIMLRKEDRYYDSSHTVAATLFFLGFCCVLLFEMYAIKGKWFNCISIVLITIIVPVVTLSSKTIKEIIKASNNN